LSLEKWDQHFAFAVQDFYKKENKDDPNFVQWTPMIIEGDGEAKEAVTYLEYHKCTDEDWELFYEPSKKYEKHF
jgi:hypothetical protein